jgi:hypothetical protein
MKVRQRATLVCTAALCHGVHSFCVGSAAHGIVAARPRSSSCATRIRMSEEVESFDLDFDVDKIEVMNSYLTDVKQKGYVPAR